MLTQVYCGCCLFRLSKVACGLFCHVFISSANKSPFKNVSKCLLKECLHVFCFSQLLMFKDFRRGGFDLSRSQHAGFWRSGPCLWEVRHELVINASYCELRLALTKLTLTFLHLGQRSGNLIWTSCWPLSQAGTFQWLHTLDRVCVW